jgi:hypothetical protein
MKHGVFQDGIIYREDFQSGHGQKKPPLSEVETHGKINARPASRGLEKSGIRLSSGISIQPGMLHFRLHLYQSDKMPQKGRPAIDRAESAG